MNTENLVGLSVSHSSESKSKSEFFGTQIHQLFRCWCFQEGGQKERNLHCFRGTDPKQKREFHGVNKQLGSEVSWPEVKLVLAYISDKFRLQPEKNVGATVVVLFVGTEYIPDILRHTAERMKLTSGAKKRIIWLASESWDRNNDKYTAGDNRLAAQGAIVLMLASQKVPSFEEYFMSLHPGTEKFERNKWLRELWQVKYKCDFDAPPGAKVNR